MASNKRLLKNSIKALQIFHVLIIFLWFIALALFLFTEYKIEGASYLILVGGLNIPFSTCPLTVLEGHLLKASGERKPAKNFTPRLFQKLFGFDISYKLVRNVMTIFLIISLVYLVF